MLFLKEYVNGHCNGYWEIEYPDEYLDGPIGEKIRVCNMMGGYHYHTITGTEEIVEANGWDELDYRYLLNNDSDLGWIAPGGQFYGCGYAEHSLIAELIFHKSERDLEEAGYIKIFSSSIAGRMWYIEDNIWQKITPEQKRTLREKGFEVDDD